MPVRFFIATLGCKVNQYESHSLSEAWREHGWFPAPEPAKADFILINTCAVTARAVADARAAARRLRREAPDARIWLTGCAAEVALREESNDVDAHGATSLNRTDDGAPAHALTGGFDADVLVSQNGKALLSQLPCTFPKIPALEAEPAPASPRHFPNFRISGYDRSRPVLKVQDGCSHRCTYCIVPLTRGPARSRPPKESLAEARRLLDAGFREITLSGINLRQYRHKKTDLDKGEFWDLVEYLERELAPEWAGRLRLRISSLEPGQLDARALDILGHSRLIAPHLHLSLQSGSPAVLARMGRGHYDPAVITGFLNTLRKKVPLFGLGADILTGFPGESEEEFEETLRVCRELPFSYAHVFPYSKRPGTTAATMAGQVPQEIKKERAAALRQAVQGKKQEFLQELLRLPVLHVVFEDQKEGTPEVDARPEKPAPDFDQGEDAAGHKAALGSRHRAAQARDALRGVCEFYSDCLLEGDVTKVTPREITQARPVGLARGLLVVRPYTAAEKTFRTASFANKPGTKGEI